MKIEDFYLECLENINSNPVRVIDSILSYLKSNGDTYQPSKISQIFNTYAASIMVILGKQFRVREIDLSVEQLFSTAVSDEQKVITFAFLYELFSIFPKIYKDTTLSRFYGLMDQVGETAALSQLKLSTKRQNHEKIAILEDEILRVINEIRPAISSISKGEGINSNLGIINRSINKQISKTLLLPRFRNIDLPSKIRLIANSINELKANLDSEKCISFYRGGLDEVESLCQILADNKTSPLFDILDSFTKESKLTLDNLFESSEITKAPKISIKEQTRKYPLSDINAGFNLGLVVENLGDGLADGIMIEIREATDVNFPIDSYFLGILKSAESITIHFAGTCTTCASSAIVEIGISYNSLKGEHYSDSIMVILSAQDEHTNWEDAKRKDPYSIQPVTSEELLVGRDWSINKLLTSTSSNMMGSAFIYGQKRVGKTSIAQTFLSKARQIIPSTIYISFDVGNAGTGDPKTTVDQLVKSLYRLVRRSNNRFLDKELSELNGSLSPFSMFISEIQDSYPDARFCFVLDEFDELPSGLYSGELGNSFFQAIRSMTSEGNNSFILIGGEKIQRILTNQGTKLNKFDTILVDYFDKATQWDDYDELVRRPASNVLEYSNDVIQKLYDVSAGNPYYTKKICQAIYNSALDRRDSYVGIEEFTKAYNNSKNSAGVQSFAHFWTDGLLSSGDETESMYYKRKCLLIAIGKSLRSKDGVEFGEIYLNNPDSTITETEFRTVLNEFVSRRIIDLDEQKYSIRVKFFRDWLTDIGISEIIADTSEKQALLNRQILEEEMRVKDSEIERLISKWPSYKNTEKGIFSVRKWLNQFEAPQEQRDMFSMLEKVTFVSQSEIMDWCSKAFLNVQERYQKSGKLIHYLSPRKTKRNEYVVAYLESSLAKSGTGMGRLFVNTNDIVGTNLVSKLSIKKAFENNSEAQVLFVIDDFVGTGNNISKLLAGIPKDDIDYLIEHDITVNLIAMFCTYEGEKKVAEKFNELGLKYYILVNRYITDEEMLLTDESKIFTNRTIKESIAQILEKYSAKIGLKPYGYGGKGLLLVFDSNCPNNSIPVLWSSNNDWFPLFERT